VKSVSKCFWNRWRTLKSLIGPRGIQIVSFNMQKRKIHQTREKIELTRVQQDVNFFFFVARLPFFSTRFWWHDIDRGGTSLFKRVLGKKCVSFLWYYKRLPQHDGSDGQFIHITELLFCRKSRNEYIAVVPRWYYVSVIPKKIMYLWNIQRSESTS
jgi:hypothetical protein